MADKALLCGINDYKTIGDLRGCVNDTLSLQKLLLETFGFKKNAVRVRKDAQVNKDELRKGWEWLLAGAKPGDRLVFHFSGHGSYTNDRDGDEADGVDELLCLYGMDWNDPDTYLLDDELREWTEQIPAGVLVTFILDSCHSGTATRMVPPPPTDTVRAMSVQASSLVDVETSAKRIDQVRGRTRSMANATQFELVEQLVPQSSDQLSETNVLVRFAPPPPQVTAAMRRGGVRSTFDDLAARTMDVESREPGAVMNHVLWSGSQSDQTSADAFIGGDYHGAFTYYFCQTISQNSAPLNSQQVIQSLRQTLSKEGFRQIPQLEPDDTDDVVFRSLKRTSEDDSGSTGAGELGSAGGKSTDAAPSAAVWLQIAQSLQQIANQLSTRAPAAVLSPSNRGLVYVHGICLHSAGYSDSWFSAMSPHLSPSVRTALAANRHEVLWSRHVSPTERAVAAPTDLATVQQQHEIESRLQDVLRELAAQEVAHEIARSAAAGDRGAGQRAIEPAGAVPRAAFGIPGLDCVDDFAKYLSNDRIREAVIDEVRKVVRPLLLRGDSIEVISHSWGTVVAYEALRAMESEGLSGRVHAWFTVGAALSISFVNSRLRPSDGRKPTLVDRWINIDAKSDFVGGSLQAVGMRVDQEFLDLHPAGCTRFGWPLELYSPACAHSSYFNATNQIVNRDIFAAAINTG